MKTDRYTKVVLTVIAACLIILVFKNTDWVEPANAAPRSQLSTSETVDVRIVDVSRYTLLPVEIKNTPLSVTVK